MAPGWGCLLRERLARLTQIAATAARCCALVDVSIAMIVAASATALWSWAPLWSWASDGAPLRLGLRVPRAVLAQGLSLSGGGAMQWRPLPLGTAARERGGRTPSPRAEIWIEVAICAPCGRVQLRLGGDPAAPSGAGPAFVLRRDVRRATTGCVSVTRWEWCDGTVDERTRTTFAVGCEVGGAHAGAVEALSETRAGCVCFARRQVVHLVGSCIRLRV